MQVEKEHGNIRKHNRYDGYNGCCRNYLLYFCQWLGLHLAFFSRVHLITIAHRHVTSIHRTTTVSRARYVRAQVYCAFTTRTKMICIALACITISIRQWIQSLQAFTITPARIFRTRLWIDLTRRANVGAETRAHKQTLVVQNTTAVVRTVHNTTI